MQALSAKIRKLEKKGMKALRKKGLLPAVIYGPGQKTLSLEINLKEFKKIYQEAGESSLINLEIPELNKDYLVLIHEIQKEPLEGELIHVDFYQAPLTEEVEAKVPIIFKGISPAVKDLGGTLVKNISEVEIKALPQNLPKEVEVLIDNLKHLEDKILIKELRLPKNVNILKSPDEIIAWVASPEKIEDELGKPAEEKVEEIEVIEKGKREKENTESEE